MKNCHKVENMNGEIPASVKVFVAILGVSSLIFFIGAHVFYWMYRNKIFLIGEGVEFGDDKWGQYGDFIGGVTNPVISLLTFGGLLYTILVQRRELSLQRRELSNSSQALKATQEELRQTKEIAASQAEFYRRESKKKRILRKQWSR